MPQLPLQWSPSRVDNPGQHRYQGHDWAKRRDRLNLPGEIEQSVLHAMDTVQSVCRIQVASIFWDMNARTSKAA
jgi:hypothetical protein